MHIPYEVGDWKDKARHFNGGNVEGEKLRRSAQLRDLKSSRRSANPRLTSSWFRRHPQKEYCFSSTEHRRNLLVGSGGAVALEF